MFVRCALVAWSATRGSSLQGRCLNTRVLRAAPWPLIHSSPCTPDICSSRPNVFRARLQQFRTTGATSAESGDTDAAGLPKLTTDRHYSASDQENGRALASPLLGESCPPLHLLLGYQAIQSSSVDRKIAGQIIKSRVAARSIRRLVLVSGNVCSSSTCGESTSDGLLLSCGGYRGQRIAAVSRGFQAGRACGRSRDVGFPSVDHLCTSCASAAKTGLRATPSKFREAAVQDGENIEPDVEEEKRDGRELTVDTTGDGERGGLWNDLPDRYKAIFATSLAFVICNMDKVNMSIAIIPMSHQLGWNASTAGLVQSSFFWGYALSQLPGGWLAKTFTGKRILRAGVLLWSLATAALPTFATVMPALLFSRLAVGLGEGVSPSSATDLIARTVPATERSRAVAFVFGGLNVGSVAGLLIAPQIIKTYGWETVFYIFGLVGIIWCFAFESTYSEGEKDSAQSTQISALGKNGEAEKAMLRIPGTKETNSEGKGIEMDNEPIPWKEILKSPAVWAMIYAHFCGNWGHYTLLSWLPTYFSEELNLDLTNAAAVSILPAVCSIGVSSIAAPLADKLISNGVDTTRVRKVCQTIAFVSPAACMAIACLNEHMAPWAVVGFLTAGIGLSSVAFSGFYCTHQDISPKYASVLLGITSTAGAIPGVVGVALVGYIFDETQSWDLALFVPSIFFYLTGAVVWNMFASSEPQSFESVPQESKAK